MPLYIYKHPDKEEYTEVVQTMNEEHVYFDKEGLQWKRVFTKPTMSIDTQKVDKYSAKDFVKYTANKAGTVGEIMDAAKEMSEARAAENGGVDPIKEKYYEQYAKDRKGQQHPDIAKRDMIKALDKKGIEVEL